VAWKVSNDPVEFRDAIAWFRKRVAMTKAAADQLTAVEKRKAFWIAGAAQLSMVEQAWKATDAAIKKGASLEDFKKDIGDKLKAAWGGSVANPAWRLETIFRNNAQLAYGAGRHAQANHPDVICDRPVWMFDAILDGRETLICKACDGTKLPATDAWWSTHTPPLHHNCRSSIITLDVASAGALTKKPTSDAPDKGWGLPPSADEWTPDTSATPKPLKKVFDDKAKAAPPPPPPTTFTEGLHAKALFIDKSLLGQYEADIKHAMDFSSTPELLRFLEKNPITKLSFERAKDLVNGKDKGLGWYYPVDYAGQKAGTLRVASDLLDGVSIGRGHGPNTFGERWTFTIASRQTKDAIRNTLLHELGHHVHLNDIRARSETYLKVDALIREAFNGRPGKTVTRYAGTDRHEYFAECFNAYYSARSELRDNDPSGFKMVEDVLKLRGILP
jgi:hypothetical protein